MTAENNVERANSLDKTEHADRLYENLSTEEKIIRLMTEHKKTLSAAESCTGGLFSAKVIGVSGASAVYESGFVTYANKAKHRLIGVKKKTLEKYGAVSRQTAKEMVKGTLKNAKADYAVAITGVAGPCSVEDKPVGLVYIGCGRKHHVTVKEYHFSGERTQIREACVESALSQLYEVLQKDFKK